VVDTNVLISGAFGKGETINLLFNELFNKHQLLTCEEILEELHSKLDSPKLRRFIDQEVERVFISQFKSRCICLLLETHVEACRDPEDDKILSLAISASADCIVSGDKDLLILHPFESIPILSPSTFLEKYSQL
jgi:putative PIN family toxin of toxin-antitoxin system